MHDSKNNSNNSNNATTQAIAHMTQMLQALDLIPEHDPELLHTPKRFVHMLQSMCTGHHELPPTLSTFAAPIDPDPVAIIGIGFHSMCVHHLLPFFGTIDVAYLPGKKIIGFGSVGRAIDYWSKRPQVQERLMQQIATQLIDALQPQGLLIRLRARQMCMELCGSKKHGVLISYSGHGALKKGPARAEMMDLFMQGDVSL